MARFLFCSVLIGLQLSLAGCRTTHGLPAGPADAVLNIPENIYFLIHVPDNLSIMRAAQWKQELVELVPPDHIFDAVEMFYKPQLTTISDPNAYLVVLRGDHEEPGYNFLTTLPGLTLFIIPGCENVHFSADFEVYRATGETRDPARFHYEGSETHCTWLPEALVNWNTERKSQTPQRVYRQFFLDFDKQRSSLAPKRGASGSI